MTKSEKLRRCVGCRNNFYNGNNDLGVKECWSLKDMTFVKRIEVPIWQPPPYSQPVKSYPKCFRRPGYAYLEKGIAQRIKREAAKP